MNFRLIFSLGCFTLSYATLVSYNFDLLNADVFRLILWDVLRNDMGSLAILPLVCSRFCRECKADALMTAPKDVFYQLMHQFKTACLDLTLPSWSRQEEFIVQVMNDAVSKHGQEEATVSCLYPVLFQSPHDELDRLAEIASGKGAMGDLRSAGKLALLKATFFKLARFAHCNTARNGESIPHSILAHNELHKAIGAWIVADQEGPSILKDLLGFILTQSRSEKLTFTFAFKWLITIKSLDPPLVPSLRESALDVLGEGYKPQLALLDMNPRDMLESILKNKVDIRQTCFTHDSDMQRAIDCLFLSGRHDHDLLIKTLRHRKGLPIDDLFTGTGAVQDLKLSEEQRVGIILSTAQKGRICIDELFSDFAHDYRGCLDDRQWTDAINFAERKLGSRAFENLCLKRWPQVDYYMSKDREHRDKLHPLFVDAIPCSQDQYYVIKMLIVELIQRGPRTKCPKVTLEMYWKTIAPIVQVTEHEYDSILQIIKEPCVLEAFASLLMFVYGADEQNMALFRNISINILESRGEKLNYLLLPTLLTLSLRGGTDRVVSKILKSPLMESAYYSYQDTEVLCEKIPPNVGAAAFAETWKVMEDFNQEWPENGDFDCFIERSLFNFVECNRPDLACLLECRYKRLLTRERLLSTITTMNSRKWAANPALRCKVIRYVKNLEK